MRESEQSRPSREWTFAGRRPKTMAVTALAVVLCLGAAACQATASAAPRAKPSRSPAAAKPAAQLSITPANGARVVQTDSGVSVHVANGKLTDVTVKASGGAVTGTMNSSGTAWHTNWALHNSTRYTVTASATGTGGRSVTRTSTFRTVAARGYFSASTFLGHGAVYGVGMPIMITFSQPIVHRRAIERSIEIRSSKPVVGTWMWDGNQTLDFRPRTYWPQHTHVSFLAHFKGVEAAPGVYGLANLSQSFNIGNSLIVVASTRTHYMHVWYKNKPLGRWAISTGMPGDATANGTYLTIDKHNPTRMVGNGYNVLVPLAVRFTWSGNYIHWAAWSVAQQGITNVSHGCVNISPAHAAIYYPLARPGDPVTIIGSPTAGKWDDGWTEWFLTWKQALRRSALHLAVEVGPHGSTFVNPATLPASLPANPLQGPAPWNYLPGMHLN